MRTSDIGLGLVTRMRMPLAVALAAGTLAAAPAVAQDYYEDEIYEEHYEYEPGEGVHEEEWYDPSDWFDDEFGGERLIDYEEDEWDWDWGWNDDVGADYSTYDTYPTYDDYYTDEYAGTNPDDDYIIYYTDDQQQQQTRSGQQNVTTGQQQTRSGQQNVTTGQQGQQTRQQQDLQRRQQQAQDRQRQMDRQQQQMSRAATVSGVLDSYRRVQLQGQREPHTVVKLQMQDGRTAMINLGPRADLRDLDLQQGDRISVEGRRGTINGRPVLMATRIRADGQSTQLRTSSQQMDQQQGQRDSRMQRQQSQQDRNWMQSRRDRTLQDAQMGAQTQLRGRLQSYGEVQLKGQQSPHTIVELKLDNGQEALVDLGPNVSVRDLNLQRGDEVTVQGRRGRINQQPVLMATTLQVKGQTKQLQSTRTMDLRGQVQQQSQQQSRSQYTQTGQDQTRQQAQQGQQSQQQYRQQRVSMQGDTQGQSVSQIISNWPSTARQAAQEMQSKYGEPDLKTSEMLVWNDSGPFVKSIVYKREIDHNFPVPHKDVLEQFVNYDVPADKMDELAQFDGSIIVFRTDGLMSARCHKQDMNTLALNLADQVIKGESSVEQARQKFAETAKAYMQGDRQQITQQLQFDSGKQNTQQPDTPDERAGSGSDKTGGAKDTGGAKKQGGGSSETSGSGSSGTESH